MDGKISVLMGIYNCASTLSEAVKSIQDQTYTNWELILCDDCSDDDTFRVAERLSKQDNRIVLLHNDRNLGLNKTLNRCLAVSSGEYIARMDGDDLCVPERFEVQVKFLEEHADFDIVSSKMFYFDEAGVWGCSKSKQYPQPEDVVTGSPICHAPVMLRKTCIDAVHGYTEDPKTLRVEDVDLWIKLYSRGYRCYNIQTPLYYMRNDQNALKRRKYRYRINSTYVRLRGCKAMRLGCRCYVKAFSPMLVGLIPAKLRQYIRKHTART